MPKIVDVKIVTFIPEKWINLLGQSVTDADHGVQFNGNNRGFTSVYGENFKTYQILSINTSDLSQNYYHEETGQTIKRTWITSPTNAYAYQYDQVSTSCLSHTKDASGSDWVRYIMHGDCANPLMDGAPAINWEIKLTIHKDGTVHAYGDHDGYPNFEIYKSYDGGSWTKIYTKSHGSISNLGPGLDVHFDETV